MGDLDGVEEAQHIVVEQPHAAPAPAPVQPIPVPSLLSLEPDLPWDDFFPHAQFLFPISPVPSFGAGVWTDFCVGENAGPAAGEHLDDHGVESGFGTQVAATVGVETVEAAAVSDNPTAEEEEDILVAEHVPHVPP